MKCEGVKRNDPHHSRREAGGPSACKNDAAWYDPATDRWYCFSHKSATSVPANSPAAKLASERARLLAYRAERQAEGLAHPERIPHGTGGGYTLWGCRCPLCSEAMRAYRRPKTEDVVDPLAAAIRRTRSDAYDRGARDHVRRGGAVVSKQRPAMDALGIEPGTPMEFKHADVKLHEYATAIGLQLLRREMGLDEWPLCVQVESTALRAVCDRYGIGLQVMIEEAAA